MFNDLSERLSKLLQNLRGQSQLTAENIEAALQEIRRSLLAADVAYPVIEQFITDITPKALGKEVSNHLNPGQVFIKFVYEELVSLMGNHAEPLNLRTTAPAIILVAGLQGSGKTTSIAKLARYLQEREHKKVSVVSVDVYRPAAIEQLQRLAEEIDVTCFPSNAMQAPLTIAQNAVQTAKQQQFDVLLIDTAGRLHIDDAMMNEIKQLHATTNPIETLFVVDSMTGQDAANTAKAFHEALPLTGVILTKTDGDARGGAALSIRYITGKPIKFLGIGEKTDALETFHPERIASRILGMGDILSLIEEVERNVDRSKSEKLAKKLSKGKDFDFEDFREQLLQMQSMGGLGNILGKLPGMSGMMANLPTNQLDDKNVKQIIAIINSMTPKERRYPDLIKGSRKQRIANGSGTSPQAVNQLLKQFKVMQKMMKKFTQGGMKNMLRGMKGMLPNGFF